MELHSMKAAREDKVRQVEKAMAQASRGPGYPCLGFQLLPSELRAAAEAAVDALEKVEA
jgi:hypothetical protein